jgi:hypothetical protein
MRCYDSCDFKYNSVSAQALRTSISYVWQLLWLTLPASLPTSSFFFFCKSTERQLQKE